MKVVGGNLVLNLQGRPLFRIFFFFLALSHDLQFSGLCHIFYSLHLSIFSLAFGNCMGPKALSVCLCICKLGPELLDVPGSGIQDCLSQG